MNMAADGPYGEFAVQSNFSFLRGASRPEELVVSAQRLGFSAIGIADRNTVAGVVRAWQQARTIRFACHPGCRLVFCDGTPDILAYPQDRAGWGHLCRMLTAANMRGEKGRPDLLRADLIEWGERISLALLPDFNDFDALPAFLDVIRHRFANALWLAVAPAYCGNDSFRLEQAAALSADFDLPVMAVNDVLYHIPERRPLQDVLTAIRLGRPVSEAGFELAANGERHLKTPAEMARLFRLYPQAIAETQKFAATLAFDLRQLEYNYPDEPAQSGLEPQAQLQHLAWEGAHFRYPAGVPEKVGKLIDHELGIIERLNYARYFLTVHDIVKFARSRGILCQGRGSAANSVVCFCIGITEVGPDIIDCLFERFISEERGEPPDIDVDFEHERRDEVIAYIYEKYSNKRTALAASVVTYRRRSALRDVARAMGFSEDVVSALSASSGGWPPARIGEREAGAAGLSHAAPATRHMIDRANEILGFPRHLSQHVGGFVITKDRLDEIVPIVKTGMDERRMVEWDKDDLDALKILKVDILALGMLSCLRRAFDLLETHYDLRDAHGRPVRLATIPPEDSHVYDMICRADTLGVFQIESRAQMSMLPRLRPRRFYDLVIEVAIVRPGPIQGDMVHPYLRRRQGKEAVCYPKPELAEILGKTLGVPLFQEQVMRIAIIAGGFSPGEADQLRRAMATFRRTGTIGNYRHRMVEGMVARGYERDFAQQCFKQIEGFGEYGFPESHAASFALLVYASCWLKAFYPDIFCAALLNAQPMGFYGPAQLVRDAQEHGVEIRAVDVNFSDWDSTLEKAPFDAARIAPRHEGMGGIIRGRHAVRLGFRQIKGLQEKRMRQFAARRGDGYLSVHDMWLRSGLDRSEIERLAEADAMRSLGLDRRAALWAVKALDAGNSGSRLPLFDHPHLQLSDNEVRTELPIMPPGQHVIHDYESLGFSLKAHPVSFLRPRLDRAGVMANGKLASMASGRFVHVCGLVLVRQRPGNGNAVFLTLEDEQAVANIIIWSRIFEQFRAAVTGGRFIRVGGRLQLENGVIHVVASRVENLTHWLGDLLERAHFPRELSNNGIGEAAQNLIVRNPGRTATGLRDHEEPAHAAGKVMPRGRNFH